MATPRSELKKNRAGDRALPIATETFERLYRKNNRVVWDWTRMRREGWKVDLHLVTSRRELRSWSCPWYLIDGKETQRLEGPYRQVRLAQLRSVFVRLNRPRKALISKLARAFRRDFNEISFPVALLERPGRATLLLDGCHRVSALLLCPGKPFVLLAFRVKRPT